jgi:hypothetical protein
MRQHTTKLILLLLFILLLSFSIVIAEGEEGVDVFSAQASYDWLSAQALSDGSFSDDVYATSLSILALDQASYPTDNSVTWLVSTFNDNENKKCFEEGGSCSTKASSFATLALDEAQDSSFSTSRKEWFEENLQSANSILGGDFLFEAVTTETGTCSFSYNTSPEAEPTEKKYTIEAGVFKQHPDESIAPAECVDTTFLDLDSCIGAGVLTNNPGITLDVSCDTSNTVLTLIYKSDDTYFILANENSNSAEFVVNNGCYSSNTATIACDFGSTQWAGYAGNVLGANVDTLLYSKEAYTISTTTADIAAFYLATNDDQYITDILDNKNSDGSFDSSATGSRDIFSTAVAILALKESGLYPTEVAEAKGYLQGAINEDGSWESSIETTSMVLYAAFGEEFVSAPSCTDGIQNGGEDGIDCGGSCIATCDGTPVNGTDPDGGTVDTECLTDIDCELLYDDTYTCFAGSCSSNTQFVGGQCITDDDCDSGQVCIDGSCITSDCNGDGKCEYPDWDETSLNCPSDCSCGDGLCDGSESATSCPSDCGSDDIDFDDSDYEFDTTPTDTKKGSGGAILLIVFFILILAMGGGGYYAYKKGMFDKFKKKPKNNFGFSSQGYKGLGGRTPLSPKIPPLSKPLSGVSKKPPATGKSPFSR